MGSSKMFSQLLIITLVGLSLGGDHHGDGHDDNCVDNSRHGELQYNTSTMDVCTHKVERICTKKTEQVCIPVPKISCEVVAYADCNNRPTISTQRCDTTEKDTFVPKHCSQDGVEVLEEVKQMPVCTTVTKQQCDSKWVINDQGEKVWDGNENCRDVSWEDCTLVDKVITEEVTTYSRTCQPTGNPVCAQTSVTQCTNVEWEECREEVRETCNPITFNIPFQTFHHTLRCSISNDDPYH